MRSPLAEQELGQFIPLHYHSQMLASAPRMHAFADAISRVVPEGSVVLELGAGTGVLSFFAAKRAARVFAVERLEENASVARALLDHNGVGRKVTVVHADANDYLPPVRVDVVICEMLHVGLLREKQAEVIASFKRRYLERFGPPLPRFIPEAIFMGVQPLDQGFNFFGYDAPIPMFVDGRMAPLEGAEARELAAPQLYAHFEYAHDYPTRYAWSGMFKTQAEGRVTALRFVTKNILAVLERERRTVDWHMQYLIMPVKDGPRVGRGQLLRISFDYEAGAPISDLGASLRVL